MYTNAYNRLDLRGRVIQDPEFKETKSGKKLLTFNFMYFTRQTTDSDGSHTNFIQVEVWNRLAEILAPVLTKGMNVVITGDLVQKRWTDENGLTRSNYIFAAEGVLPLADMPATATEPASEESVNEEQPA